MNHKRYSGLILALGLTLTGTGTNTAHAGTNSSTVKGPVGQTLSVTPTRNLVDQQIVTVTGKSFDTKTGIYVAFCVIPQKGKKPENCFGGININGSSKGSIWISSTAPFYQRFLARPYGKSGSFKVQVMTSRYIDTVDCKVTKCGVVTRADHHRSDYRKADVLVPITFK